MRAFSQLRSAAGKTQPFAAVTRLDAHTGTGGTLDAHLTAWRGFAANEKAQIFWFDFTQGRPPAHLTQLIAYDATGNRLP
jgi:hypothetical protein